MSGAGGVADARSVEPITVLLADDHPALRMGLRLLLDRAPDIRVIEEVGDGERALARGIALAPTVMVLDCRLPGLDGVTVAARLRERGATPRVLALSAHDEAQYVRGMLDAGAAGYLLKDEAPGEIVAAVRAVARGKRWFSRGVVDEVRAWDRGERPAGLTERELDVLRLLARGSSNGEIAQQLGVKERTAVFHVSNILRKLDLGSRVEAAVWARDHGLGLDR
ncbi:MAG: response regulator transcription factor [Caldilineae bacterium]|nr:response regulator transcription factor [Chloroflexota bacterium]MCB9175879.1 response regulator transcription factor [Caldilineae bacterium]